MMKLLLKKDYWLDWLIGELGKRGCDW